MSYLSSAIAGINARMLARLPVGGLDSSFACGVVIAGTPCSPVLRIAPMPTRFAGEGPIDCDAQYGTLL